MLLNHLKHRSCRTSQNNTASQQESTFPALKESTIENLPDAYNEEKITQDSKSNQLMNALLNSKRTMAATFSGAPTNHSPTALQENNPFKKRVEEYFKQYDNISLQQKLRTLAPTTINNLTMTTNRNNPLTTKPFLVAPFEKNPQFEKKFAATDSQRVITAKNNYPTRLGSADSRRDSGLSTDGDNMYGQDSTVVSNVTKIIRGARNKSNETTTDRLEKKLASLRIPSYTSIDKDSVETTTVKTKRRGESVKPKRSTGEQTRTRRRDSLDSDSCLNFKTASTLRNRYMRNTEEDFLQKEGSLMKYFRAKAVKQRPATTKEKAPQKTDVTTQATVNQVPPSPLRAKTAAPTRTRGRDQVHIDEAGEKDIDSADTSFEGFSVLDSFNASEGIQITRPTTAMDKGPIKLIEAKRGVNKNIVTGQNTTMFSSQMNRRSAESMDVVLVPDDQLNYSDDDEALESSIVDGISSSGRLANFGRETHENKFKENNNQAKKHEFLIQIRESRRYQNQNQGFVPNPNSLSPPRNKGTTKDEPITERLVEENELNLLDAQRVEKSGRVDQTSSIQKLKELVDYAKQKGQLFEVQMANEPQDKTSKLSAKFSEALAMADIVQMKGGVVQRALRSSMEAVVPTVFKKDANEVKEAHENIEDINEKLQTFRNTKEQLHQQHREKLEQAKIASVKRLTNTELNILYEEMLSGKAPEVIDVERIDVFLKRLKFFSELGQEIRFSFYKNAVYLHQQKGEYVFHQGDDGDLMYVILKGSVNVKILKKMKDGQSQLINVNSLYDGTHFGELAIMGMKPKSKEPTLLEQSNETKSYEKQSQIQERLAEIDKLIAERYIRSTSTPTPPAINASQPKRAASIQCSEETEFLAINRDKFQEILFSIMHKDLDAKVRILHQIPFFKNEDSFHLMPIANLLQIRHYKLGQRVIKTGEALSNFYLIAEGRCKVVSEITDQYALDKVDTYKDKLKPFKFKLGKNQRAEEPSDEGFRRMRDLSNPMRRTFDNEPFLRHSERGSSAGKEDKFMKHVFFKELLPGNCFGFRPLLKTDEEARYQSSRENHAKLSVIAESPNVEIYVLSRTSLMLVPERVKNLLLDGIAAMTDFDDCDISKPVKEHQMWRKYQVGLIEDALTKTEHPNLRRYRDMYKAK